MLCDFKTTSCVYRRYVLSCLVVGQIGGLAEMVLRVCLSGLGLLDETGLVLVQTSELGVESFLYPSGLSGSWDSSLSDLFH